MKIKRYADGTLKSWNKDQLIEYIRELEHNWAVAEERCDNQYTLLQRLTKDMSSEEIMQAQRRT